MATTFCKELPTEFHENPRNTLFADTRSHGQTAAQRGVVSMKGIILLIYKEHLIKIVGIFMKRLNVIQPNQTNVTV